MKRIYLILIIFALAFISQDALSKDINEVFDFSYRIIEGTANTLILNESFPNKRIEFRIDKKDLTVKEGFKIYQMIEPSPDQTKDNIVTWRIEEGYPQGGYFYIQSVPREIASVRDIYYSDKEGTPLNFTLVFGIKDLANIREGKVCIKFIVESQGGGLSGLIVKNLDIEIKAREVTLGLPEVKISTISGAKRIYLNPKKEKNKTCQLLVNIKGNFKEKFFIKQRVKRVISCGPYNLDYRLVNFDTQEVQIGQTKVKESLSDQPYITIYSSEPDGRYDPEFMISYGLEDLSQVFAGRYTSEIQYFLEYQSQSIPVETLELEVEVEPVFELKVIPEEQKNIIEFKDLKPNQPPQRKEVILEIETNLGKPYQVNQSILSELTNKQGDKIPLGYFTFKTEGLNTTKGTPKIGAFQEVKVGDTILFISDNKGSSDKFKVIYELKSDWSIKAGNYSTQITYSLTEI